MTTVSDVNSAFAAERATQIDSINASNATLAERQAAFQARVDSGKLVPLGNGQFRINDPGSWDDGEVWYQSSPQAIPMPQSGLDESLGSAALYSTTPAWHGLGNVVPGGVTDIDEVLKLGGIDFEVEKHPTTFMVDGVFHTMPNSFVTVRSDTNAGLGVVGKVYTPIQNREQFTFLEDLVGEFGVTWESAGALRGGRTVFVSMRLPDSITIDAGGINDEITPFIMATNSHDGTSLAQVVVTPWRPICGNTERFALRDANARWGVRHTKNAMQRVDEARRTLGLSKTYFDEFSREEQALAETALTLAEFGSLIDELWTPPDHDASKQSKTIAANRTEKIMGYWSSNTERLGRTAYAAERAITEYADWGKGGSLRGKNLAARATMVLEGADDALKTKAHRKLLTLTNK